MPRHTKFKAEMYIKEILYPEFERSAKGDSDGICLPNIPKDIGYVCEIILCKEGFNVHYQEGCNRLTIQWT